MRSIWCSTLKWLLLLSLCTVLCWHVEIDSIPTDSTSTTLQNNNQQNFPAYNTNLWWPPFSTSIHHPLHSKATLIRTILWEMASCNPQLKIPSNDHPTATSDFLPCNTSTPGVAGAATGSTEILKLKTAKLTIMDEMLKDVNCTVKM